MWLEFRRVLFRSKKMKDGLERIHHNMKEKMVSGTAVYQNQLKS